jgi:hypothetical protein
VTPGERDPREEPELHAYGTLIARARAGLPGMTTEALYRIRALLERALTGDRLDAGALAEFARTLGHDA